MADREGYMNVRLDIELVLRDEWIGLHEKHEQLREKNERWFDDELRNQNHLEHLFEMRQDDIPKEFSAKLDEGASYQCGVGQIAYEEIFEELILYKEIYGELDNEGAFYERGENYRRQFSPEAKEGMEEGNYLKNCPRNHLADRTGRHDARNQFTYRTMVYIHREQLWKKQVQELKEELCKAQSSKLQLRHFLESALLLTTDERDRVTRIGSCPSYTPVATRGVDINIVPILENIADTWS